MTIKSNKLRNQVKSGFYYMGSDPANLGVPEFKPSQTKIRIRRKGDRFTTALLLETTALKMSDYDIDLSTNFILNAGR